jgi:hypothetical protein
MLVRCDLIGDQPEDFEREMRYQRDGFLVACDWTQLPDSPLSDADKAEWATYRQQLRDFPATWTPAATADFPDPPA